MPPFSRATCFRFLLVLPFVLACAPAVFAAECAPDTGVKELFLGETANILATEKARFSVLAAQGRDNADYDQLETAVEYGIGERWQFEGEWQRRYFTGEGIDNAVNLGVAYQLTCGRSFPILRLDAGFHHDGGNGVFAGLTAGQRLNRYASWQASARRNDAVQSTRYTAAILLGDDLGPLALEASAKDTADGWERWVSAGFFVLAMKNFDIGFAYADGGGLHEGERLLMVRLSAEF